MNSLIQTNNFLIYTDWAPKLHKHSTKERFIIAKPKCLKTLPKDDMQPHGRL